MKLSRWAHEVSGYIPKNAFMNIASIGAPSDADIDSFIRLYIFDNIPNFISSKPIAFDRIRQRIASELEINDADIKLTGSAKLGFSLNPGSWLKEYAPNLSDLDFFIVSEKLYNDLQQDLIAWENNFRNNKEQTDFERLKKMQKGASLIHGISQEDIPLQRDVVLWHTGHV